MQVNNSEVLDRTYNIIRLIHMTHKNNPNLLLIPTCTVIYSLQTVKKLEGL